jgi:glycosyltransferase involved in cell wall biosynthesis
MKIVYVCADRGIPLRGFKGASTHLREMATALSSRGNEIAIACARLGSGNPEPSVSRIEILPDEREQQEDLLGALLRTERIDVVLERYSLQSAVARRVTTRLGVPLVLEVNAPLVLEASRYRGLRDVEEGLARERGTFETADAIVAVSGALGAYVGERAPQTPVAVVPNGVDPSKFAGCPPAPVGLPEGGMAIGFCGSMKRWHGIGDLLEAFRSVAHSHPQVDLVLAGSGPEDEVARRVAEEPALTGRIHILGPVAHDRVPGILAALSVGVAPYPDIPDFYFSPLKVLEYMAAGVPVVFSNLGDLPDMVQGAGIGYPAGDVPALTRAILRLVEAPQLRRQLGAVGRARSLGYSWDRAAKDVEEVLRATMATGRRMNAAL